MFTVQRTQFGVTDVADFASEQEARERYSELCADRDTTEAWIFAGTEQGASALAQYVRGECRP